VVQGRVARVTVVAVLALDQVGVVGGLAVRRGRAGELAVEFGLVDALATGGGRLDLLVGHQVEVGRRQDDGLREEYLARDQE